jgi:hypothetical protein
MYYCRLLAVLWPSAECCTGEEKKVYIKRSYNPEEKIVLVP